MKIIDTHCHPQMSQYDSDRDEIIRRALDSGIGMICVGVDLATSRQAVDLAERYEGLYASVGLHPNDNLNEAYDQDAYLEIARHPKVVAIGEIGLDYYRTTEPGKREFQKSRFAQQLNLARLVSKPVIIHCRDAHNDMLSMLPTTGGLTSKDSAQPEKHPGITRSADELTFKNSEKASRYHGVIHSFTGTPEQARAYIEKGYYIGLNGIVTFSKEYEEMVRSIPLDRMLLETDSPYLAPAPYRGKRNQPLYVDIIGNHIAAIIGEDPSRVFSATTRNAELLFSIIE